ncbi:MAG: hypothetical protein AB8I56_03995 [Anaerolineales bacterium]
MPGMLSTSFLRGKRNSLPPNYPSQSQWGRVKPSGGFQSAENVCSRAMIFPKVRRWCFRKPLVSRRLLIQRIIETIFPFGTPGVAILVSNSPSWVGIGLGTGNPA